MNKTLISIIILILLIVGFYFFIWPVFRVIELDDSLPISTTDTATDIPLNRALPENPVTGTFGHRASGVVKVIRSGDDVVVRYENFQTIDGPNLHVYLTKDLEANEFIDLGQRKGTKGNINYVVPKGVDIDDYKYIVHWCVPFRVLFNYAELK